MTNILDFATRRRAARPAESLGDFLDGFSIEVMPRTAAKIDRFAEILPAGTRVYVAHIEGTPFADMLATAKRISAEGFAVMPHVPARIVADRATLRDWIERYRDEAGVEQALVLGGGVAKPHGAFDSAMQLLGTGEFDRAGYRRLHVAGHPEGNADIDPSGGEANVMAALAWKQSFRERTDAEMAIVTQFCFEAAPVVAWAERLAAAGVRLPIHIGVAGPAKLQTLIRFAMSCGVGPSLRVLQRRAADVTRLVMPHTPEEVLADLARHRRETPGFPVEAVHFFPLGGIRATTDWTRERGRLPAVAAAR